MAKQETILIADDAQINRAILRNLFEDDYNLLEAENGETALLLLRQYQESIAAVLLDLIMPVKNGYEVLEEMRRERRLYHVPVVVITAEDSTDNRVKVFEMGASDIIAKPFEPAVVRSRVNNIIELGRYRRNLEALVEEKSAQVRESNAAVIDMLSSVIEYRSLESGQHIRRIRMFTKILLEDVARNYQEYNLTPHKIRLITESSSMHDIGKIAIPDSILNKPGKLTEEEFEVMKTHTLKGCEILSGLDRLQDREYLQYAYEICRYHHERWDGRGYPDGLKGNSIPLCAQVVAIADCFDALTTDRVYKKAIPPDKAFSMILNGECGTFSPKLLECFKNVRIPFARLSEEYADGLSAEISRNTEPAAPPDWDDGENMLEQSQQRYFALLSYLDSTVMEVDLQTGVYHLVYLQDQDFSSLRSGSSFREAVHSFAKTAVHPDDRADVLGLPDRCIQEFFDEGQASREWRYRILDRENAVYVWCRCTLLRVNLENPRLRRVLLIWRKEAALDGDGLDGKKMAAAPVVDQLFGGLQKSRCDRYLTILQASRSLTDMLGYTRKEIAERFQDRLLNLICPEDRGQVIRRLQEQRDVGRQINLEYRMAAKDGHIVWVSSRGAIENKNGEEVMYGILLDVTQPRQEELNQQAREQQRQAQQYDQLFQSMICGIVHYRMEGQRVVFKRANREAIRIFGYEPEAFWAKQDWDLAALAAEEDRGRVIREAERLCRPGDQTNYEYRFLRRDGTSLWIVGSAEVVEDGGETVIQSVFLDVDARKKAELRSQKLAAQVEASNEILHLALEHTTTCEFYYNPQTRECTVPERTCEIYHCRDRYTNMPQSFAMEQVDQEYRPAFYEMYQRIQRGEKTAACVFHGISGRFWCRETLSVVISDDDGSPRFVVGIIEDITQQKEMEAALEAARSKDSLTGLYKTESGIRLIQEYLDRRKEEESCALMLLAIDDFEEISRREGEPFAGAVLQETADILRAETGEENIQIRLGRDSFMGFIKHCGREQAMVVGQRIAGLVGGIIENSDQDIKISASIGMCSTGSEGEYQALYQGAERALEFARGNGGDCAACFIGPSAQPEVFPAWSRERAYSAGASWSRERACRGEDLVSFALDLLGKAKNIKDAVHLLLARIGRTYHFDRVSIIEADRAFLTYRFSYQWARNNADLQMGEDFYVSEEDFEICAAMYDEDGLADHNVREGISHISSCLHAGIWDYGEYAGSMSFEVDREDYRWSKEERKLLRELVKIVPSFIMKSKADAVSQAKTDFLSRMSHEIRTPMNAISGMTTIAKSVLDDRDKTLECLEKIEASNRYLLGLINDILDMSRIESGKLELNYEPVNLSQQLKGLESMFRVQAAQKHLSLVFRNGYREGRLLEADSLRLNQVLVNIIGNAVKFTDYGGVTVLVEELEASPRAVLRFSVSDTGIGIDPSAAERIFNAFEQAGTDTAAQRGGTGLGLSISRRLVQMMGGTLEVRSQAGAGSEFSFVLTLEYADGEEETEQAAGESESLMDFQGRRVLLAEDNEINREIAQTILEMYGFDVTCAADGREALELFCAGEPGRFDAILMDIRMPVMDGLESTRRIRTCGRPDARSIPIIALTANAFDEDTRKSMESGMNGHLSKPVQIDRLLELLGKCLRPQKVGGNRPPDNSRGR